MNLLLNLFLTIVALPFLFFSPLEYKRLIKVLWKGEEPPISSRMAKTVAVAFILSMAASLLVQVGLKTVATKAQVEAIEAIKAEAKVEKAPTAKAPVEKVKAPEVAVKKVVTKTDPGKRVKNYMMTVGSLDTCKRVVANYSSKFPTEAGFCESAWQQAKVFANGTKALRKNNMRYKHLYKMAGMTIVNVSKTKSVAVPYYQNKEMDRLSYKDGFYSVQMGVRKAPRVFNDIFDVNDYFN